MDTHYRTIIEHSREAVVIFQQCQIKYANPTAATLFGLTPPALIELDILDFLHPDNRESAMADFCAFIQCAQEEKSEIHSIQIIDGNGVKKLLNMRLVAITWDDEPALACYITDVSADMRMAVEVQEREAIFNALIDQVYNGIAVIQNGRFLYLNEQMAEIVGYSIGEMINTEFAHYIHPDELSHVLDTYNRRMNGEEMPVRYESRLVHKNGRSIDVQFNADIISFQGQLADFVFVRDITERKQQQAELERQNRELSTLYDAAIVLSSDLSLDKVLEAVAVQMTHALGTTGCSISLWRKADHVIETLVDFSFDPNQMTEEPGTIYKLDEYPATMAVLESRKPYLIRNDDEDADKAELALMQETGTLVLLMLPLIVRDQVIGIVELFNQEKYYSFSADEIKLAASLAAQAAVAVENAQLYAQAQAEIEERLRAEKRANRYLEQQLIVNQLALSLGQLTLLDDIYNEIFEQVSSAMPVDQFIISFYDDEAKVIRAGYVYAHGQILDVSAFPKLPLAVAGKGIQSQVIRTGQPVYVADRSKVMSIVQSHHAIHKDGSLGDNSVPVKKEEVAHSHLHVPMMIGGKPIGVMQIQYHEKDAYNQADIDLLAGLANIAAIAIQNARLLATTQEQAQQVDQIVNSVPEGVLLLDANKRLVMANPAGQNYLSLLTQIEDGDVLEYLGERPLSELLVAPPNGLWHEVIVGSRAFDVVARVIEAGSSFAGGWVLVIHDVTQEKESQTRLEQQNRLAAVGQLAAGIAHDFNNIMTVINLYTDLIGRSEENLSTKAQKRLEVISQQSNRAADLIEQILDFSRRSVLERRAMDFLPFLKEVIKLLDRTLIENVHINLEVESGDYTIHADPTRMQQMILNLAVNARDAMPYGGELKFTLSSLWLNGSADEMDVELPPGHWLKLQVSDNGTGIEQDVLSRVFDPFFTTKAPGSGSGLGLAQVWGIVKQHEGHITVSTVEDRGTTFTLYLPLFYQSDPVFSEDLSFDVVDGCRETILLVEDNKMTRQVLVESLNTLNYEVITAVHGLDALEIMKVQGEQIALIISDVVMPEMGGIALLKTLRVGGWETAVLLLTGHPLNKELDEALTYSDVEWMSKPVTLEQLAHAVSRRLNFV